MNVRSLKRYETIVENLPVGLMCVSDDGMVVLANRAFCSLFKFNSAVEGMPFRRVIPTELQPLIDKFNAGESKRINLNGQDVIAESSELEIEHSIFGKVISFQLHNDS